ncbi:MAG: aminotransferase class I/II-fold pyridoxal phosphate-dependent enzyme, partial [Pseudomonadota bacterium]
QEFEGLGLRFWKSQANFVLVEPKGDGKRLFEELLKKGVIVRPMPLRPDKTFLRISIGNQEENEACVAALKELRDWL